jgi:hypothetical protein
MGMGDHDVLLSLVMEIAILDIAILPLIGYFLGGLFRAFECFILSMVFFGVSLALWYNKKVRPPIDFRIVVLMGLGVDFFVIGLINDMLGLVIYSMLPFIIGLMIALGEVIINRNRRNKDRGDR